MLGRIAAVLITLAGCDRAFDLQRVDARPTCPAEFRELDGSSYYRGDELKVTWHEAETACENLRGDAVNYTHLVVISSDAEMAAILGDLSIKSFWIGHHDLVTEGTYVPVSTETIAWPPLTTPPWAGGQPNNLNNNQHCLAIDDQALLDDKKCVSDSEKFRYVCECDLFASNAPLPP